MKLLNYLNGKKTIIGTVFLFAAAFGSAVLQDIWTIDSIYLENSIKTCEWIGLVLGGTGLVHKTFKTNSKT